MKFLILSDIHSNLEAFESVIYDAELFGGFDQIWSLGDLIGYGPDPSACIDLLRQYSHRSVAGNHDLAAIGRLSLEAFNPYAFEANQWTTRQISKEQITYVANFELKLELDQFTLVHGSPRDPIWEYVVTISSAVMSFLHFDTPWCLLGHSHIPFLCRPSENGAVFLPVDQDTPVVLSDERLIANPGSVGQPRDGDPRASYMIYDSEALTLTHHRTEYDIAATQEKMRRNNLPRMLIDRLSQGT